MKISLNWLKKYIPIEKTPEEIAEALILIGLEVDAIEKVGLAKMDNLVVGEVLKRDQHPNADRLGVCEVAIGKGVVTQIVCGATNYKVGDRVPVALVGCILPGNFEIKKAELRGVESNGMMCSMRELGLGDDHSGLMILTDRPEIGTPMNEVMGEQDTVFEVELTPNRPDCLSHIGIARELAAYFDLELTYPQLTTSFNDATAKPLLKGITVRAEEDCLHYRAYSIRNVKIGPSPKWLRTAIESIGQRSISNVVDVTNYVLHELGQPLHAFDAKKIKGEEIIVRYAKENEEITTLDDVKRKLTPQMMVIADAERPLVIAGVMGSVDAEVDDATVDIVLESAYFSPKSIRWTSRSLNLTSDSSYRFERGVDQKGQEFAALRAVDLILEVAGGELCPEVLVVNAIPDLEKEIKIVPEFVRERLGFGPEDDVIKDVFERLSFDVKEEWSDENELVWAVSIPSYRGDLDRPIDLVEEFLRIYGTDKIPAIPVSSAGLHREDDKPSIYTNRAQNFLVSQGFLQSMNYSLLEPGRWNKWFNDVNFDVLALENPLTADETHMRPSLLPGLLETLKHNQSKKTGATRFFEAGHTFFAQKEEAYEMLSVGFVISIDEKTKHWRSREAVDFFTGKRICTELLKLAGYPETSIRWQPQERQQAWQKGHAAYAGEPLKTFKVDAGLLNLRMLKELGIEGSVLAGTVTFLPNKVLVRDKRPSYQPISFFPETTRDLAFLVDVTVTAEKVREDLSKACNRVCKNKFDVENVRVFDLYEGKGMPEGKKSLALAMTFRASDRTLTDIEVNEAFAEIQKIMLQNGYTVRA